MFDEGGAEIGGEAAGPVAALACPPKHAGGRGDATTAAFESWVAQCSQLASSALAAGEWAAADRAAVLALLDRAGDHLTLTRARVLEAERQEGTWAHHGDRDLAAWRARTSRRTTGTGLSQVRQADTLAAMPQVASALGDGGLTADHVDRLARVRAGASAPMLEHLSSDEGQREVVELGCRLDATQFTRRLEQLAAEHDPAKVQRDFDAVHAQRYLNLSDSGGATLIKGQLDPLAGHRLRLALQAVTPKPGPDDDRSDEQRRADGLCAIVDGALAEAPNVPGDARPTVCVVLREDTFAALRAASPQTLDLSTPRGGGSASVGGAGTASHDDGSASVDRAGSASPDAGRRHPAGSAIDVVRRMRGTSPVVDASGTPWPASAVAQQLCDCRLARIVVDERDVAVNLGRSQRLFSAEQRRAMIVRDGGLCGWPGCSTPARWAEAHHLDWWSHGGRTDADRGVLLCSFHHHLVHRRSLTLERIAAPPGATARWTYRVVTLDGRPVADPAIGATGTIGTTGTVGTVGAASRVGREVGPGSAGGTASADGTASAGDAASVGGAAGMAKLSVIAATACAGRPSG